MSKTKSEAWSRKNTRFSKGVMNYHNVEKMGRVPGRIKRSRWKQRNHERMVTHVRDIVRQEAEGHIDFNLVKVYLDYSPGMSLEEAKAKAVAQQARLKGKVGRVLFPSKELVKI